MPASIVLIAYRKSSSGIATYTTELAKALSHDFEVIMPAFGLSSVARRKLEERGIKVIDFGRDPTELEYLGGPIIEYHLLSRKIRKYLLLHLKEPDYYFFTIPGFTKEFRTQNLLVNGWGYGLLNAILTDLRYLPSVLKIPSMIATIEYWLMDSNAFMRAKKIICLARSSYEFYKAKFGTKVVYIPPPIEYFTIERKPAKKLRVLFVSRDLSIPRKNLITLLRALNMLNGQYLRKIKLMLVGRNAHKFEGWLNNLKMKGAEVDALGYVDREHMASIYLNSDILVYPSYYEELGYAVLEAMAYSLPIIASNIPSFNDMVIDGYNGFIIEPSDYRKLARLLSTLIEDREMCHKMGKKSIELIKEKFDPKLVAQRFKDVTSSV